MARRSAASMPLASWSAASSGSTTRAAAGSPTARCSAASPGSPPLLLRAYLNPQRSAGSAHREIDRSADDELCAIAGHQGRYRSRLRHDDLLRAALVGERKLAAASP